MTQRLSRRGFLKGGMAAAAFTIIPGGLARGFAANAKVNLGIIGAGAMGAGNRRELNASGLANIVALCDIDRGTLAAAAKEHPDARLWEDFREMLEKQKEIDAVMVSTPDHIHYPASMLAMKLGKHVSTEKPMAHTVWEARQLAKAAREYKVVTQHDHENHASGGLRTLVEWVKTGAIGTVREVHIWSDRPIWPQGIRQRPAKKPVPANLNWDLWLGPAPYIDYHDGLHPFKWRGWWDYGCGALGDMGCHFWDSAVWALDLGHPDTIEAQQEGNTELTGPNWSIITYQFPQQGQRPPVKAVWYDGKKLPPRPDELEPGRNLPSNGSLFIGDKGKILVSDAASPRLIPESKMKEFIRPAPFLTRPRSHKIDWLEGIRGGPAPGSNFTDFGGHLAEVVLLGNVAIRAGNKIEWDGVNLKAKNAPQADQYIRKEYRKGWEF